ncbi:MAG: electron transport complex subunit RsxC [Lentimicrobium sp.]|nr:electron transport complex subunit RsxC [Lentimicrobium sp.]MDD2527296.1 electron transport complex subunit RsxC [Lentimicrobiaceae bacterium]MDD4597149.1 electron transport complex subunit RsxC [Lentimicrobiaceae bacterium]MDY0025417.1 electron transport complex subunit RsxC [Lentimicrobium sp.]HAH59067.1 electron transport complex subunit RsxC [Bacteroidales bacterium]
MVRTFKIGGVHPPELKLSADREIELLPLPAKVIIPLSQSLGAPSRAAIQKGDLVKVGQLIAKGESFISSNVHSSVSGKVTRIDDVMDSSGYRRPAVLIDVEGDEWEESIDRSPDLKSEITASSEEIIRKIYDMGVVGLGGATFPSHVKLRLPEGKKAEYLLINGVECEPYLTADHRVMLEQGEEVITGIRLLMRALAVEKAFIGIENNKPDAIHHLQQLCIPFPEIEVVPLKVKYPQGGEKQLIKAVTGRETPSGKLPLEVGCVVQNVGTALAVYEAVQKNKPLIDRVVTVTGKKLDRPSNLRVRIGTPVGNLIEYAGGLPEDTGKVISGGPMMGKALSSLDVPVVKGTSGILLMPGIESKRAAPLNCIRCGRCVTVCPMGLEPILLAQLSENFLFEKAEKERIMDCIECGSCQYTCPAGRPLLDYIRLGKNKTGIMIRNRGKK